MTEIKKITPIKALEIIEKREPLGLFYATDSESSVIGIDNQSGDAWTENFKSLGACMW